MKRVKFFSIVLGVLLISAGCETAQSPRGQIEDTKLTAQVKAKLASDVSPSTVTNIHVNTTNRVVTLAGQVETEQIKNRAEQVAQEIPGVVSVNNNLQVEATGGPSGVSPPG